MVEYTTLNPGVGGDNIATDDLTTLNGGAVSGFKVQRVKVGYGDDASLRDVSASWPLPIWSPDTTTSGTLSATDAVVGVHAGAGVLLTGTPTASSYLAMAGWGGESGYLVQLTGTFGGGTVWFESSANSTNGTDGHWTTLSCRLLGTNGTTVSDSATTAGLYRGNAAGMTYVRARVTGATTPSIATVIRLADGGGPTGLNAALPAGTNQIGTVGPQPATTGTITSPALSATTFTILASNAARKMATVYNDSTNTVYLALAATASTTAFTAKVEPGGYYELPGSNVLFTGLISGISAVATGNLRVTELT